MYNTFACLLVAAGVDWSDMGWCVALACNASPEYTPSPIQSPALADSLFKCHTVLDLYTSRLAQQPSHYVGEGCCVSSG